MHIYIENTLAFLESRGKTLDWIANCKVDILNIGPQKTIGCPRHGINIGSILPIRPYENILFD